MARSTTSAASHQIAGGATVVTFVFSNPRHHLDMMVPVAHILQQRAVSSRFVSLAELRGFTTPDLSKRLAGIPVHRAIPLGVRRNPAAGAGAGTQGLKGLARRLTRAAAWHGGLARRLHMLLRGSDVVVLPNDAAYPYGELCRELRAAGTRFALLQEGIRFELPSETDTGLAYGTGGATALCTWGEASAEHFRSLGAPPDSIRITGNPRFDGVHPPDWIGRGQQLSKRLGLNRPPLLFLSNTIDDQGFCTTNEKMELFATFLRESQVLLTRRELPLVVKLHPREDVAAFRRVASKFPAMTIRVLEDEPLFAALAMGEAAVVLASTVGLEALAFGLPLAVMEIPRYGHVFEYVSAGAAVGLRIGSIQRGLEHLLTNEASRNATSFVERHMAHRGEAARRIADEIEPLSRAL